MGEIGEEDLDLGAVARQRRSRSRPRSRTRPRSAPSRSYGIAVPALHTATPSIAMSNGSGALPGSAIPSDCAIRPQFGSPPCSAAFTSGEFATARATFSTPRSSPPRTTTRPVRRQPSPSATICSASWRSSASSASPKRSSSALSGSTTTPLPPLAWMIAVSFVESCPSTEIRSKLRFTHTPSSRSAVSGVSCASVCTKQSIVAKLGWIIPAPFACAVSRTVPEGSSTASVARLANLSVVRIASAASRSPSCRSSPRAARIPRVTASPSSCTPITPVEATATCSSRTWETIAAPPCIFAAASMPRPPVAAFAFPEFATIARSPDEVAAVARDEHRRREHARAREARGAHGPRLVGDDQREVVSHRSA